MKNQSGQASAEFIFSMVIAVSLFILFLSIATTFTVVEVGQYIAFSTSRAHAGANTDLSAQRTAAISKYQDLQANPAFGLLFKSGWYVFGGPQNLDIRQGKGSDFRQELGDGGSGPVPQFEQSYTGVSIPMQAKVMGIKIPYLNPQNDDDSAFSTHLNAILIREPTMQECFDYWKARKDALSSLSSAQGGTFYKSGDYVPMEDSGC